MKKRGFTLVELLGVIVVLGVIASTLTFVIINTIEDSKKDSALSSAEQLIKAVTLNYTTNDNFTNRIMDVTSLDYYKGKKPEVGYIQFNDKENARLYMKYNGYCVTKFYDSNLEAIKMGEDDICDWNTRTDTIRKSNSTMIVDDLKENNLLDYKIYGNTVQNTSTANVNLAPDIGDENWTFTGSARLENGYIVIPADTAATASIIVNWDGQTANSNGKYPIYFGYTVKSAIENNKILMGWEYLDQNKHNITGNGYAGPDGLVVNTDTWKTLAYDSWDENNQYGNGVKTAKYIRLTFKYSTTYCKGEYRIKNIMLSKTPITSYVVHKVSSPTPNNQSEIKSLGSGGNLFGSEYGANYIVDQLKSTNVSASIERIDNRNCLKVKDSSYWEKLKLPIKYKENTQYTMSMWKKDTGTTARAYFKVVYTDGTASYLCNNNVRNWTYLKSTTTYGKTVSYIVGWGTASDDTYIDIDTWQLQEGAIATNYMPYGNNLFVKVTGRNIVSSMHPSPGGYSINAVNIAGGVKPNTTYTVLAKFKVTGDNPSNRLIALYSNGGYSGSRTRVVGTGEWQIAAFNITTPAVLDRNDKQLYFYNINKTTSNSLEYANYVVDFEYVMAVEGEYDINTIGDYEEFKEKNYTIKLNEPLRCIDNTCDYIDYTNKKVVRNVKQEDFSGDELWYSRTNVDINWTSFYISKRPLFSDMNANNVKSKLICSHLPYNYSTTTYPSRNSLGIMGYGDASAAFMMTLPTSVAKDATAFKTWIKNQNASGNQFSMYYLPTNPDDSEKIDLPDIELFDGYNNIMITDGNLYASKIEIVATKK